MLKGTTGVQHFGKFLNGVCACRCGWREIPRVGFSPWQITAIYWKAGNFAAIQFAYARLGNILSTAAMLFSNCTHPRTDQKKLCLCWLCHAQLAIRLMSDTHCLIMCNMLEGTHPYFVSICFGRFSLFLGLVLVDSRLIVPYVRDTHKTPETYLDSLDDQYYSDIHQLPTLFRNLIFQLPTTMFGWCNSAETR